MIQLRAYRNNDVIILDLFKDEPIEYEMSFAEIQDITSKNGGFTKSFSLPGSRNNNLFFENYYNPQSSSIEFNTNQRITADIIFNGYEILNGYIRLENAVKTGGDIFYNVTFYNETGNLLSQISDKKLKELDTSNYFDHVNNWTNIYSSWDINPSTGTNGLLEGRVLYPLLNRGYRYNDFNGVIELDTEQIGIFDASGLQLNSATRNVEEPVTFVNRGSIPNYYFPISVQVKALFECICENAGFRVESNFFNTNTWFKRIYMPLTFKDADFGIPSITNKTFSTSRDISFIFNQSTQTQIYSYTTLIEDIDSRWVSNTNFLNDEAGYYQFVVEFDYKNETGTDRVMKFEIQTSTAALWDTANKKDVSPIEPVTQFICKANTEENLKFTIWAKAPSIGQQNIMVFRTVSGASQTVEIKNVNFRQIKSSRYRPNILVDVSQEFGDDYLQVDFISSVLKQFNLVLVPKPNEPKTLLVEPIGNYIGRGQRLDWSQKVDRSKSFTITNTNQFINGVVELKPLEGKDFSNEEWKKGNNPPFGTRNVELSTDFRKQSTVIQSGITIPQSELIKPTVDYTLPVYYQAKDENVQGENIRIFSNFKTTPTFIYYSGIRNIFFDRGVYMNYEGAILSQQLLPQSQYFPQSHHLTYFPVSTFSQNKTITFNKDQKQGTYKNIEVHDDCYTLFYEELLNDYLGEDGRFVECSIYLTPEEIKELNFSEVITIDNTEYRINKITGYDLTKGSIAQVELVKIWQDYTQFGQEGTDKIKLNACGAGVADLYTTINLSPGIILLTNTIIKVGGTCYYVDPPSQFDPSLTYQIITPDNINGVPFVYPTCEECGETGGDVCEPIVNVYATENINSNLTLIAEYRREEYYGSGYECITTKWFWDCNTNKFEYYEQSGFGQCVGGSLGWTMINVTPTQIPFPVNRPGFQVDDCCYDPNTGFNYDIYVEQAQGYPDLILHKICCDIQPTTTTSTTESPTTTTTTTQVLYSYIVRDCRTDLTYEIVGNQQLSLFLTYLLILSNGVESCFTVLDYSVSPVVNVVYYGEEYQDCETCLNPTPTTTTSTTIEPTTTTTTTTQEINYIVRDCSDDKVLRIVSSYAPLTPGQSVYISGVININKCWTVVTTTPSPHSATVINIYDDCIGCYQDNSGGGQSSM